MDELMKFMAQFGVSEDDALKALLGAMSPIQPPALRQNWSNSRRYGNSAPSTKEIWMLFVEADFRCTACGSQRRITLDHVDGDPTNHLISNLRVLCSECNRGGNKKATVDTDHQLRIYRSAMSLFEENGAFPSDSEVRLRSGTAQIGGALYFLRYMKARLVSGR